MFVRVSGSWLRSSLLRILGVFFTGRVARPIVHHLYVFSFSLSILTQIIYVFSFSLSILTQILSCFFPSPSLF